MLFLFFKIFFIFFIFLINSANSMKKSGLKKDNIMIGKFMQSR